MHPIFRANIFHLEGRDLDLVVDTGMGWRLSRRCRLTPGKPVLAVATHIHADHVGSLHEFAERAGPRLEAEAFATMDDRFTFADMFRALAEPVTRLPHAGWSAELPLAPAPLTRILDEGDVIDTRRPAVHRAASARPLLRLASACYDERDGMLFSRRRHL